MKEKVEELRQKLEDLSKLMTELSLGGVNVTLSVDNGFATKNLLLKTGGTIKITVESAMTQTSL